MAVNALGIDRKAIDRKAMVVQQQEWVKKLRIAKYENILQNNPDISLVRGTARFVDEHTLMISQTNSGETFLRPDRILLAVGASPYIPKVTGLHNTPFWTSTEALVAEELPQHLLVIGGSVVALELAQAFRHLASDVTIITRRGLLSKNDTKMGEALAKILEEEGIHVKLHTDVSDVSYDVNYDVNYDDSRAGKAFKVATNNGDFYGDKLLIATGRQANSEALALSKAGVQTDTRGAIIVDDHLRTNVEHIYAVGDCTSQPQFVYVAAAAGTRAAQNMMGGDVSLDLSVVPEVIFTHPQAATVGLTETQAEKQGIRVESRTLALTHVPRALANMNQLTLAHGFIKLVIEKETLRVVGCQVVTDEGGEIIQTAAMAIRHKVTVDELAQQLFPYLTMVEGLKLCAQTFTKDVSQLSCCAG